MTFYSRNLIVLCTTIGLASLCWTQIIPFLPTYLVELGVTANLTAWSALVLGLQAAAAIVFMPFWGKMGDRYGRKPMVIRAGFCLAGIYTGMVFCTRPWHLALLRFLNGVLTGFIPGSMALIATNTPPGKTGRHVAIAQSAAAIGSIAGPVLGGVLVDLCGIRGAMWVSGGMVLLSTFAVIAFVSEPHRPRDSEPTTLIHDFCACGRNRTLRFIMLYNAVNAIIGGVVVSTLAIFFSRTSPRLPGAVQGAVFAIPGVLMALLSLQWVRVGERLSYRRTITIGLLGTGAFYMVMGLSTSVWLFIAAFVVSRVFATALTPSLSTLISSEVEPGFRGRAFGIQTSVGTMGELAAQVLVASIGQLLGIRALYVIVGAGVFALGIRNHWGWRRSLAQ